jgi:hypothetical protein
MIPVVTARAVLLAMVCSGCSASGTSQKESPVTDSSPSQLSVSARLVALEPGPRHPESTWTFHLELQNRSAQAQWFVFLRVLGESLDAIAAAPGARLDTLASPQGPVPVVRLLSGYEVVAFRLPPGGQLAIERMPLSCWNEQGASDIEVWALNELLVGGKPIEEGWLKGQNITAPQTARIAQFGTPEPVYKHLDPELENTPVELTPTRRWKLLIDRGSMSLPWAGGGPPADWPGDDPGPAEPLRR